MSRTFGLAALAAAMLASASPASADKIKFDFWYGNTGAIGEVIAGLCKNFNESQDKYEANCTGQGGYDKAEQNAIAAYRAKQQPTLLQLYDAGTVNFMLSGAVIPAVKFAKDNNINIDWADYFPAISNFFATSKGELWSLPFNNSTALMYFNKDALAKINKAAPPANLEELTEDLKAMKAAGYDCGFALDFDPWVNLEQFSYISNIPLATKNNGYDGLDAELMFNKTKAVDFAKLAKSWLDNGYAKIMTAQTGKDKVKAFADGSCQITYTSVGDHATVTNTHADSVHWGVAPLPVFKDSGRVNSAIGGASVWIMAGKSADEYAGAAEFIKYITNFDTGIKYIASNTGYIPVTKSGFKKLTDAGFYKDPKFAGREVALQSLEAAPVTPVSRGQRLGNYTAIRAAWQSEFQAAMQGQKDIQQAYDDAVKAGNDILRRYEQTFKGQQLP